MNMPKQIKNSEGKVGGNILTIALIRNWEEWNFPCLK